MSGSANVQSFESITAVRTALVGFGDQVAQALSMIDIEMRRVLDWLEHDRPRYWRHRVRLARDEVNEARAGLHRCLMYPIADERPACREERARLKQAQAHQAYCEEKAERLKHWTREVRHELFEYEGRIGQLSELVELDLPRAVSILSKLLLRLEEYEAVRQVDSAAAPWSAAATLETLWPEPSEADASTGDAPNDAAGSEQRGTSEP